MSVYSAKQLEYKTHEESPWLDTEKNEIITYQKMLKFFKQLINETSECLFAKEAKNVLEKEKQNINNLPEFKFKYA